MEPEGPLPHSQQPATCPYPEPDRSSPCPPSHFSKIRFNIITQTPHVPCTESLFNCSGHTERCPTPRVLWQFLNTIKFIRWWVVSTQPNAQAGGPPLAVCPRLLMQYIQNNLMTFALHVTSRSAMGGHGLDRSGSGYGQVAGSCECGNEPSSSIHCGDFPD
jgi:hypothetical protein